MKDLVILGAGGSAKEVAFLAEEVNKAKPSKLAWNVLGFIDVDDSKVGKMNGKYPIIGDDDFLMSFGREIYAAFGIGSPGLMRKIHQNLSVHTHIRFPNLIHPGIIWDNDRVKLGEGNVICAGSVFTTDILIGSFNFFNRNCSYGHDMAIGSYCVFNPGVNISGGVKVGDGCLIGTGATVLQSLNIGEGATIGAGALVTKDVPAGVTVIGVPARPMMRPSR